MGNCTLWQFAKTDSPLTDAPYLLRSLLLLKRQSGRVMYAVYRQTSEATIESACMTLKNDNNYNTYGSKLTNKATKQRARYCSNISLQRNVDDAIGNVRGRRRNMTGWNSQFVVNDVYSINNRIVLIAVTAQTVLGHSKFPVLISCSLDAGGRPCIDCYDYHYLFIHNITICHDSTHSFNVLVVSVLY